MQVAERNDATVADHFSQAALDKVMLVFTKKNTAGVFQELAKVLVLRGIDSCE